MKKSQGNYIVVDWMKGSGIQWIDTGITPSRISKWELYVDVLAKQETHEQSGSGTNAGLNIGWSNRKWKIGPTGTGISISIGKHHLIADKANNKWYMDENSGEMDNPSATRSITLFMRNTGALPASYPFKQRILESILYDTDGNVMQRLVPRVRAADGKPGMLDLVTNEFFTNQNPEGEDFTYGNY